MGTKDVIQVEFERLRGGKYKPGDRLTIHNGEQAGESFTFKDERSYFVEGDGYSIPRGHVHRYQDDEEINLAIKNALKAGYYLEKDQYGYTWWEAGSDGGRSGFGAGKYGTPPHTLVDAFGHTKPPCLECGLPLRRDDRGEFCFGCRFWLEKVDLEDGLRIDGSHYHDSGSSTRSSSCLGFAGRKFVIATNDGRVIQTNNLWGQGRIPERFRDRLPDNAKFLKDGEYATR